MSLSGGEREEQAVLWRAAKAALTRAENKLQDAYKGPGAAANAIAKLEIRSVRQRKGRNKATKMLRDVNIGASLERHLTEQGTKGWLQSLDRALHEAFNTGDGGPLVFGGSDSEHSQDLSSAAATFNPPLVQNESTMPVASRPQMCYGPPQGCYYVAEADLASLGGAIYACGISAGCDKMMACRIGEGVMSITRAWPRWAPAAPSVPAARMGKETQTEDEGTHGEELDDSFILAFDALDRKNESAIPSGTLLLAYAVVEM